MSTHLLGISYHKPDPKLKQENGLEISSSSDPHFPNPTCPSTQTREVSTAPSYLHKAPGRHTRQVHDARFAKEKKTLQDNTEEKSL